MAEQQLLSLREAAERYKVPVPTLRSAVQHGHLPSNKIGTQWVVVPQNVEAYLANRPRRGRPKKRTD